jgi:hypothetical protein
LCDKVIPSTTKMDKRESGAVIGAVPEIIHAEETLS